MKQSFKLLIKAVSQETCDMHEGEYMRTWVKEHIMSIIYFLFGMMVLFFFISMYIKSYPFKTEHDVISEIKIVGEYSEDNGKTWISFKEYKEIKSSSDSLIVRGHVQKNIEAGENIYLYLYRLSAKVTVNDYISFSSNPLGVTYWETSVSPGVATNDVVTIYMHQMSNNAYYGSYNLLLEHLGSGSEAALIRKQVMSHLPKILLCILTVTIGIAIILALLGLIYMEVPETKGYLSCGLLLVFGSICTFIDYDYATLLFSNDVMINVVDYLSQTLIVALLVVYLKRYLRTKRYVLITDIMISLWLMYVSIYYILRVNNLVLEADVAPILGMDAVGIFCLLIYFLISDYRKTGEIMMRRVLVSGIILVLSTTIELIHYFIANIFWVYIFQCGLIVFACIQFWVLIERSRDNIREAKLVKEMQMKLVESKVAVMMSQIQPHFLYNTISDLGELCMIDPVKANEAMTKFGRFLRGNMDSLTTTECIPFVKELEHVKNYVYLQQLRFGKRLQVTYDIQETDFMIPALTIQPLVENAIRHGICVKKEGGTVTICTGIHEDCYFIEVLDDGVGFSVDEYKKEQDRKKDNNEITSSHIGLNNIIDRIAKQCNGEVHLYSKEGSGSKIEILIPQKSLTISQ